jgi:hypothetical protein
MNTRGWWMDPFTSILVDIVVCSVLTIKPGRFVSLVAEGPA